MKACPQCGEMLQLMGNRWTHVVPGRCLLISIDATAEEVAQYRAARHSPVMRHRATTPSPEGEWKFGYLAAGGDAPQG